MSGQITQTYRFNYPTKISAILFGLICLAFSIMIIKVNLLDQTYGKPDTADLLIIFTFVALFSVFSVASFVVPFHNSITLTKAGIEYRTILLTVKMLWFESRLERTSTGRVGQIIPLAPEVQLSNLGKFFRIRDFSGEIPIRWFGKKNFRQDVLANIYSHAPYLFGILLSESDYIKTLDALDNIITRHVEGKANIRIFYSCYSSFCWRYIINGDKTVRNYHVLATRHRVRLAKHIAISQEIIQNHYETEPTLTDTAIVKKDLDLLREIIQRYENLSNMTGNI